MRIKRVVKFEFDDGHDVEFAPSDTTPGVWEAWVDGVLIEELPHGNRGDLTRAQYYYETRCQPVALVDDLADLDIDESMVKSSVSMQSGTSLIAV